jgi:AraC-like DNA-binding protein
MIKENQIGESYGRRPAAAGDSGGAGAASIGAAPAGSGQDERDSWGKVGRSIAYMIEHINEPLQVSTLAALVNVSPSHFFALFKQQTGSPPMDYFTHLRMRHACRLLGSTGASVKEVAAALGYDDPFYFSRVFKAVNNVPPSRYRSACSNHLLPLEPAALASDLSRKALAAA